MQLSTCMHLNVDKFIFACFINKRQFKLAINGLFADLIIMTAWGVEKLDELVKQSTVHKYIVKICGIILM